jgi:hypothetical protein
MNRYGIILALAFAGCATAPPAPIPVSVESAPPLPSAESIPRGHFAIIGVRNPGCYPLQPDEKIIDAIRIAGGPEMCDVCFRSGGESRLWELIANPTIMRDGKKLKFNRKALSSIPISEGDFIIIDHIPF